MGYAVLVKFPGGQQALVARARLGNPDMEVDSLVERGIDRCQRRPVVDGRQPAGVAVGHDLDAPALADLCAQPLQAVLADAAALLHILLGDPARFEPRRLGAQWRRQRHQAGLQARQRPVQIDRRRPRRPEPPDRGEQGGVIGTRGERQRDPISGGDPDQRCAAYLHAADRLHHRLQAVQSQHPAGLRQCRLVDDVDGTGLGYGGDRSRWFALDSHDRHSTSRAGQGAGPLNSASTTCCLAFCEPIS
ncbi:MAG: hypothetical protein CAPSK01_000042 [Candidatus Accumulibacter vicinus]|uniref:Uncharacterized protein n=1 Tax=Candidatus Accumulibacter vicinus TaxID=2954382 RepID=A0A084Y663_9PROT|nr:MAG: hypothetical protein CAPSK01_000042 [Candidatus Accumulibacter vicinus]